MMGGQGATDEETSEDKDASDGATGGKAKEPIRFPWSRP